MTRAQNRSLSVLVFLALSLAQGLFNQAWGQPGGTWGTNDVVRYEAFLRLVALLRSDIHPTQSSDTHPADSGATTATPGQNLKSETVLGLVVGGLREIGLTDAELVQLKDIADDCNKRRSEFDMADQDLTFKMRLESVDKGSASAQTTARREELSRQRRRMVEDHINKLVNALSATSFQNLNAYLRRFSCDPEQSVGNGALVTYF